MGVRRDTVNDAADGNAASDAASVTPRGLRAALPALAAVGAVMSLGFPVYLLLCDRAKVVWYVSDDAYYYFCVARNLATGHGLSADGLTPTTGVHALYALLLAGLYKLGLSGPDAFVRQIIACNFALHWATAGVLALAARRLWGPTAAVWAMVFWLANPYALLIAGIGVEGALCAMVVALLLAAMASWAATVRDGRASTARHWIGVGGAMAMVVGARSDLLLLAVLVVFWVWRTDPGPVWRRAAAAAVVAIMAGGVGWAWPEYCYHATGQAWSGSALAKAAWRSARIEESGWGVWLSDSAAVFGRWCLGVLLKAPALKYLLPVAPALWAAARLRGRSADGSFLHLLWVGPIVLGVAYATLLDRTRTWYYAPAIVMMTLLAAGLSSWLVRAGLVGAAAKVRRLLPLVLVLVAAEGIAYLGTKAVRGRSRHQEKAVEMAAWLQANVPPDARIGDWDSGLRSFYSGRTVINLDGLANNEILDVLQGRRTMPQYLDERNIEYLVVNPKDMAKLPNAWPGAVIEPYGPGVVRIVRTQPHRSSP